MQVIDCHILAVIEICVCAVGGGGEGYRVGMYVEVKSPSFWVNLRS